MRPPIKTGSVVLSTAGRDAKRYFVVLGFEGDDFALICDGRLRRVASPKKKKLRHLKATSVYCDYVNEKLSQGELIQDAQIRRFLSQNGFEPLDNQEE